MRIIEARGPVVDALKRYDPGLRVRWSFEKKKWAVDAPLKDRRDIAPPVFYERLPGNQYIEHLLPEKSERYINYHSGRYPVCFAVKLNKALLPAIAQRDQVRMRGAFVGKYVEGLRQERDFKERGREKRADERAREGYELLKFIQRKNPGFADGAGVSIKGAFK